MTAFPTDEELALQFLLHRLGRALASTTYEALAEQRGSWPVVFLDNGDLKVLGDLGVRWSNQPRLNSITILLGEHFVDMNNAEVSLEFQEEVQHSQSVVFTSLRK
jgi:hypothetical protein